MKEFETDTFKMTIHDDLLKEVKVKKNKTLTGKDVWESADLSSQYKPGSKFFVLLEGDENSFVSGEARRAAASSQYNENTAALALCSNKQMEAIMGNLFLKVNKPKVPTKFFDDREKAKAWLKNQSLKSR